ncbi:DUF736 domain-containing protein [Sinorhizobium meliloti]|uniref:DUF736 domain-containing protein n=1 Tax=Rhizobium meliloti TaxID=382 RepID=A0A2J0YU65_RHIML|nr:DUF736 domain-containing protein [Sinorhizobium meliloti]PJR10235.1 hypothetical protein CEJ86_29825 [Sinorhizobium meliloti]
MSATIARLTANEKGFVGTLATLAIRCPITIVENAKKDENGQEPDYRVLANRNGFELGAAWVRTSQRTGAEYISVSLRAPEFGTLYANIAPAPGGKDGEYVMIWNPPAH